MTWSGTIVSSLHKSVDYKPSNDVANVVGRFVVYVSRILARFEKKVVGKGTSPGKRADPGFEPGTSPTLRENHATRPIGLVEN